MKTTHAMQELSLTTLNGLTSVFLSKTTSPKELLEAFAKNSGSDKKYTNYVMEHLSPILANCFQVLFFEEDKFFSKKEFTFKKIYKTCQNVRALRLPLYRDLNPAILELLKTKFTRYVNNTPSLMLKTQTTNGETTFINGLYEYAEPYRFDKYVSALIELLSDKDKANLISENEIILSELSLQKLYTHLHYRIYFDLTDHEGKHIIEKHDGFLNHTLIGSPSLGYFKTELVDLEYSLEEDK